MPNVLLTIEYDGTDYHGWQFQTNAVTVEHVLQTALTGLLGEDIKLIGAGRTDAGVHARGQTVNFKIAECRVPIEKLPFAINSLLPPDIVVKDACIVSDKFHARFEAKAKIYSYLIYNSPHPSAIYRNYTYHYKIPLDVGAMGHAAKFFIGTHDFSSFKASGGGAKQFIRTIYRAEVTRLPMNLIKYEFEGSGFLYNMVRIMVGTLIEVGTGRRKPEDINAIILAKDRNAAGETMPARGLCLERVIYPIYCFS